MVSCLCLHVERAATVMAPPAACDSAAAPCLLGCPAFLQRHSMQVSSLLAPGAVVRPQLTAMLALGLLSTPMLQLPAAERSDGLESLSGVCRTAARIVCVVLAPFSLSLMSCFYSDGLKCFPSVSANCLGSHPCFTSRTSWCRSGPAHSPFFSSFLHPSEFCVELYIPFWWSGTPVSTQLVLCESL